MINYGDLLQRAFALAWRFKYLWLLGLFADITSYFSFLTEGRERVEPDFWLHGWQSAARGWDMGWSVLAMLVVLMVMVVLIILERVAEGGLVANAGRIARGEQHNLRLAWDAGRHYFVRLMGTLIIHLVLIFSYLLVFAGLIFLCILGGMVTIIPGLLILIPLFFAGLFVIEIVFSYAERFIVLDNQPIFPALGSAWRLFRARPGESVAMGAIALAIMIAFITALAIFSVILIIPLVGIYLLNHILAFFIGVFIIVPIAAGVTAYLGVYRSFLWTFFFIDLRQSPTVATAQAPDFPSQPE